MLSCCLWLCVYFIPPVFSYFSDQALYQEAETNPYTHQVWVRQTEDEARLLWQRPGRQIQPCVGARGQRGRCVQMESCVLGDLHQDYVKNRDYFCIMTSQGFLGSTTVTGIGVCCPDSVNSPVQYQEGMFNQVITESVSSLPLQQTTTAAPSAEIPNRIPTPPSPSNNLPQDVFPLADFRVCGRNGKKISRITSGAPTSVKDWPWMAALVYRSTMKQFCGGTVITRRHVLTAAHCFPKADPNEVIVLLGDYDLRRPDESKSRAFSVVQLIIHEDFDVTTFENDITIMVLNTTTIYNSFIQPCCLPPPGPRFANSTAVVTGWGKLEFGGRSPNVLMEVPIPIWEQKRCSPNFAQTIFDTNLCAGAYEGGKDSCQGDSGGPLVIQRRDERWAIVGVVSWGIRCGEKDKPGIYTRVNDYLDWIAQAIL
ncbi:proclotting enzyme-like [Homalodisca vitripennis]|nr:proclotting enzyme-like [Homalodisca vitripennis]